jgi:hypothetical protein
VYFREHLQLRQPVLPARLDADARAEREALDPWKEIATSST